MTDKFAEAQLLTHIDTIFEKWTAKLLHQGHLPIIAIAIHPQFGVNQANWDMSILVGHEVKKEELLDILEHVTNTVRKMNAKLKGGGG